MNHLREQKDGWEVLDDEEDPAAGFPSREAFEAYRLRRKKELLEQAAREKKEFHRNLDTMTPVEFAAWLSKRDGRTITVAGMMPYFEKKGSTSKQ